MADYYKVHCTNCGNVLNANEMAIDIDKMIRTHLRKAREKNDDPVISEAIKRFDKIKIGMYLTETRLKEDGVLAEDHTLYLTGMYILDFIAKRYRVNQADWMQLIELAEKEDELTDEFIKVEKDNTDDIAEIEDTFDTDDLNNSWRNKSDNKMEIPSDILDDLCFKMKLREEKDISREGKREEIEGLLQMLLKYRRGVFLECECVFEYEPDDRGNQFISSLWVIYMDRKKDKEGHMVCPECGDPFIKNAGRYEERIIVMLGSSRVGKTSYLAALVEALDPEYGQLRYREVTKGDTGGEKYTSFKKKILEPYRNGEKAIKTEVKKEVVPLFSLEVSVNGKTVILTFVDLPGEVFAPRSEEEKRRGEVKGEFIMNDRNICESANLFWFCIDPVQIDQRLHQYNEKATGEDKVVQDINLLFTNVGRILDVMGKGKRDLPVAVIITKSDLIPREANLYFRSRELEPECMRPDGSFAVDRFQNVAANVVKYLQSENIKNVTSKLNHMFTRKNYFAVAAYGVTVEESSEKINKAPSGIFLPFLWSLAVLGYIPPTQYQVSEEPSGWFNRKSKLKEAYVKVPEENLFYT